MIGTSFGGSTAPDPEDFYAAAVYGSILAAAFITVFRQEHSDPATVAVSVIGTMIVFWIAHVWSTLLGERIHRRDGFSRHSLAVIARSEWPLIEATVAPTVVLVLGWIGVIDERKAEDVALVVCVLQLFGWGLFVGRRMYDRWWAALLTGLVNGVLGILVVGLEVRVVH